MNPQKDASPPAHALAYPAFRRFYLAAILGTNGGWIMRILLSWLAWDLTRSPAFVGLVAGASLLPVAVAGPVFGAIVDRVSVTQVFAWVTRALSAIPALLILLTLLDLLHPASVFGVALLFGVAMSAYHPARQSLGPRLVERPAIGSVVALAALNFNVGRLIAPAIAGALIATVGVVPTAVLGLCMTLPNLIFAPGFSPRPTTTKPKKQSLISDMRDGVRVVWSRAQILRNVILSFAGIGVIRGVQEILALVADGIFERGAAGLGLMTSTIGGGALAAALIQAVAGPALLRHRTLRLGILAIGLLAILILVQAPYFEVALVAGAFSGFSATYVGVSLQIGVQSRLEDELRGRVMSIWMMSNALGPSIFAVIISSLTNLIGMPTATTLMLGLSAFSVVAIILTTRRD